jgi:O-antigen/teichoic acid export membrane protein
MPYFLMLINNDYYSENVYLYPWLISATIINAFGMIPHFGLYAAGNDKSIIKANIAALITFFLIGLVLVDHFHELAIPIALNFGFLTLLIFNTFAYLKAMRFEKNQHTSIGF